MKIKYPEDCKLVKWDEVEMTGRSREDFGDLEALAGSILSRGILHPPTVSKLPEGERFLYRLVGGERRMQAMKLLGLEEFPVNVREEMPEHELRELEMIENFHRKEMKWQEQCLLVAKTHKLKVHAASADMLSWGTRETGQLLGVSNAHISHATCIAELILAGDDEIIAASSLYAAYEVWLKRKEDHAVSLSLGNMNFNAARAIERTGVITQVSDDFDSIFDLNDVGTLKGALDTATRETKIDINLSALLRHGDCLELLPTLPDECVDHVVTDPPYGIDLTQMTGLKNIETVEDTHEIEQNVSMFEPFLREAFRVLRPSGYCVFWYDLSHHEKLQSIATKVGFKPQRWPLVWQKLHACLNNSPRYNFTKNMEFAMVLRKSSNSFLTAPQITSFVIADGGAERRLYDNPFSKPMAVWKFILEAIAREGQVILDPYMGQASSLRTVVNMRMIPMGMEIDLDHYNRGVLNLTKLINEINGTKG
jgi:adenine-specific DNA-methyltransferase